MYCGEVNVAQTELSSFLAAAEDLKVKGLTNCGTGENNSKRTKVSDVPESKTNTKTLNKLSRSNSVKIHEDIPMVDLVQVKSEPLLSGDNTSGKSLVAPDYEVDSGDFQYDDYQVQETGFEDEFTNNIAASKALESDDSGDPIYPCNICGRTFNSSSHCNRHYLTVHGTPVPVSCEVCGKNFKNQDSCNTHLRKFHDIYSKQNRRREVIHQEHSWDQV